MNAHFRRCWIALLATTAGLIAFSLVMVLAPDSTRQLFELLLASNSQPHGGFDAGATAYIRLVVGILGATMVGWSVALLFLLCGPFRRRQREGWWSVAASIGSWFLLDSSLSLTLGFWQNAAFNLVFLLAYAGPLALSRRHFAMA